MLIEADHSLKPAARCMSKVNPLWSGAVAYRAVVPSEKLEYMNPKHKALDQCQLVCG